MLTSESVFRLLISLAGAAAGFLVADALLASDGLSGPNTQAYMSILGLLAFYLLGGVPARKLSAAWRSLIDMLAAIPPEAVLAAVTGATIALVLTVLLNNILSQVPGFTWYWSLLIALLLVIGISAFFIRNRRLFLQGRGTLQPAAPSAATVRDKVIDTSALIDGRIAEVLAANFLDSPVLIPRFVLRELQQIADSSNAERRKRGRRGLAVLKRLNEQPGVTAHVIDDDPADAEQVDDKLISVCLARGASLITTDYNLEQVAVLQGIRVLNPNQLASAVKALYLPGDRLSVGISKPGRETGQGLAYLPDGTMVVVEEAAGLVGNTVEVAVTSSLQTNVGKMIFARQHDAAGN
jgi:uncharacterized protein YacL